ncbi:bifunctional S24 family peptidase/transcriptional regulator [Streptococcus suis]|uniref:helix-turn-helix domain-containing protein n=1 Tax=Streptococcus suis TaxID=1307 RepID=UPI00069C99A6|nr:helix-turn-helix transcriptional regulator [Streptococcus suis]NQG95107.1 helix-turn-helix transcriptional regulator [Streptococcus suis]NQO97892.1 helix-turn-helix transcriptional regulator [Streptococcus suis]CYV69808.1 bifunctional S24 family peptidase/transcriptional regulator [Streptococcus suis]
MSLGNKEIFANNLRKYLSEKGMNPRQLAIELNLKYTTVNDWVNAKSYPRIDKIEKLSNYFNINKSDLIENNIITRVYDTDKEVDEFIQYYCSLSDKNQKKFVKALQKELRKQGFDANYITGAKDVVKKLTDKQKEVKALKTKIEQQAEEVRIGEIAFEILSVDDDDIEGQKQILEKYSEEDFNKAVEYIEKLDDPDDKDID